MLKEKAIKLAEKSKENIIAVAVIIIGVIICAACFLSDFSASVKELLKGASESENVKEIESIVTGFEGAFDDISEDEELQWELEKAIEEELEKEE